MKFLSLLIKNSNREGAYEALLPGGEHIQATLLCESEFEQGRLPGFSALVVLSCRGPLEQMCLQI